MKNPGSSGTQETLNKMRMEVEMKKFITILLCIALFVCIVPTTTLVQQEVSNDVLEIERVTESFLSSLARKTKI